MYKIYFGKKCIILTNVQEKNDTGKFFFLEKIATTEIIKKINKKRTKKLVLFHSNEQEMLALFAQKFSLIRACGGLVSNAKGDKLFIRRNGKWDLPKGKLEKGELLEECALREVQEETGIKNLILQNKQAVTYHIFERKGVYYLKETHWYNMLSFFDGEFIPQIEEGIDKVKWKNPAKIQKILHKTYGNIADVLQGVL